MASEWQLVAVSDISENLDSIRVPVKESERKKGNYPYYGASGIVDFVDRYLFDGVYVLVAEDGENLKTRQTPIAFIAEGKFWVNNHAHVLTTYGEMPLGYFESYFNLIDLASYVTGTAQPKLPQAAMNKIAASENNAIQTMTCPSRPQGKNIFSNRTALRVLPSVMCTS